MRSVFTSRDAENCTERGGIISVGVLGNSPPQSEAPATWLLFAFDLTLRGTPACGGGDIASLLGAAAERLLHDGRQAGLGGGERVLEVRADGRGHVDCVDGLIGEQRIDRAVGSGNPVPLREVLRRRERAPHDRDEPRTLRLVEPGS